MITSILSYFGLISTPSTPKFDFHEIEDSSKINYSEREQMFESINTAFASYSQFSTSGSEFKRYNAWEGFITDLEDPNNHWIIAKRDSKIVGGFFFKHNEKNLTERKSFYYGTLWVDLDNRGHGLGSDLVATAEQKAKDLGYSKIEIYALKANEKLVHFYTKRGYEIKALPQEHPESTSGYIIMSKSI